MDFNIRPTFKAIRLFERMTNTSFLDIDNNSNLMFHLLYCCLLAHPENNFYMTFETACTEFFPKYAEGLVESFALEMEILNQFGTASSSDDSSLNQQEKSSPNKEENMFLSSFSNTLFLVVKRSPLIAFSSCVLMGPKSTFVIDCRTPYIIKIRYKEC